MDLLYEIELDSAETDVCPYYNFSALMPTTVDSPEFTNITIDPDDPSLVSFYLNQTFFRPDMI